MADLITGATIAELVDNVGKAFGADRVRGPHRDIVPEVRWEGNPETGKTEYRMYLCSYALGGARIEHGLCDKIWLDHKALLADWDEFARGMTETDGGIGAQKDH